MQRRKSVALAVILALTLFLFPGSLTANAATGSLGISNRTPSIGDTVTVTVSADSAPTLTFTSKLLSADSVSGGTVSGNTIKFNSTTGSVTFSLKSAGDAELILNAGNTKVSSATVNISEKAAAADTTTTDTTQTEDTADQTTTDETPADAAPSGAASGAASGAETAPAEDVAAPVDKSYSATADSVTGSNGITVSVVNAETIPACFTETTLPNTDASPAVYQFAGFPNAFYYFYGTNDDYGEDWYEIDTDTGIVALTNIDLVNAYNSLATAGTNTTSDSNDKDNGSFISKLVSEWNNMSSTNKIMVVIAIAVIVIIIIIVISMIASGRHKDDGDESDDDEDDSEDEEEDDESDDDEDEEDSEDDRKLEKEKKKQQKQLEKENKKREKEQAKAERLKEKERKKAEKEELLNYDEDEDSDEDESEEDDETEYSEAEPSSRGSETKSQDNEYKPDKTQVLPDVKDIREKIKEDESEGRNPYIANYADTKAEALVGNEKSTNGYNDAEAKRALFWARKNFYSEENLNGEKEDKQLNSRYARSVKSVKTVQKEEKEAAEEKVQNEKIAKALYPSEDDGEKVVEPDEKNIFVPKDMVIKKNKKQQVYSDYNVMNPEEPAAEQTETQKPDTTSVTKTEPKAETHKNNKKNGGNGGSSGSSDIDIIDFNDL